MPEWLLVITLIVIGFALLLIELLIIPGFGFAGVMGLLSLVAGSYIAYTKLNLLMGLIVSLGSLIIIIFSLKLFPKTRIWKSLRLDKAETKKDDFQSSSKDLEVLTGKEGISITPLRPTGTATINGKRVDVVSEGIFIAQNTSIKVISVEGNRVVVREKKGGR